MSSIEKLGFIESTEFTEYLRFCGSEKQTALSNIFTSLIPESKPMLTEMCTRIVERIGQISKGTADANQGEIQQIIQNYQLTLEPVVTSILSNKQTEVSTLKHLVEVAARALHTIQSLQDQHIKAEEKWWGTGSSHMKLFDDFAAIKSSMIATAEPVTKVAAEYVQNLINEVVLPKEEQNPVGEVVQTYLSKLYSDIYTGSFSATQ